MLNLIEGAAAAVQAFMMIVDVYTLKYQNELVNVSV